MRVKQGEVVGLLGPNGAGKTTTFYMIVGLITPDSGKVMLDGNDLTQLAMYQRAHKGISYLPQEAVSGIPQAFSVEDNLMAILQDVLRLEPARTAGSHGSLGRATGSGAGSQKQRLRSFGRRAPPRGSIARSLVIEASFLLLDEPFSGIDPIQVLELQKIIFDLKNSGIGNP